MLASLLMFSLWVLRAQKEKNEEKMTDGKCALATAVSSFFQKKKINKDLSTL